MKNIEFYVHTNGKKPVQVWLNSLDISIQSKIISRLTRVQNGNFGDCKKLNKDISELRFDFGSGYRIYYSETNKVIILLLNAGDKKQQNKDIEKAKEYLKIWRQNNEQK